MGLNILTRNIELNDQAHTYIEKKFKRLERHLKAPMEAKLEVYRTSARSQADRVVAQMTMSVNGYLLRGQERGLNLFAAIDAITDVMDRQIRRYKGKVYRSAQAKKAARVDALRAADGPSEDAEMERPEPEDLEESRVVRTKRFPMRPMAVEDAIMEMELLSHGFFLFYNIETREYNVVYRRQDGDYGVIEPELA